LAYQGFLDAATSSDKIIRGWAWDPKRPDVPIDVELLEGNRHLATVKADLLRQDLLKGRIGNGCHAFEFPVPVSLMDEKEHRIQATIASNGQALSKSPRSMRWSRPK
jgi:hypothetical protein